MDEFIYLVRWLVSSTDLNKISTTLIQYTMKPIETLFWLGTAGVLYMTANNIVKNVTRDVIKDLKLERKDRRRCLCW
jgi:hypothetical protein